MRDRKLVDLDEEKIIADAEQHMEEIIGRQESDHEKKDFIQLRYRSGRRFGVGVWQRRKIVRWWESPVLMA